MASRCRPSDAVHRIETALLASIRIEISLVRPFDHDDVAKTERHVTAHEGTDARGKGTKKRERKGKRRKRIEARYGLGDLSPSLSLSVLRPGRNFRLEKWAGRRKKIGVLAEEDSRGEKNCNGARPWG